MRASTVFANTLMTLIVAVLFAQSGHAKPSITRKFDVASYERIYLLGSAQVHVSQVNLVSESQTMLVIGEARYLDDLVFESADNTLYLEAGEGHGVNELVIYLSVTALQEVISEGRGEVFVDGLTVPKLALEGHGSGRFNLQRLHVDDLVIVGKGRTDFQVSGEVQNQYVDLAGVGHYQANRLASETGQVSVRGASQVDINVTQLLDLSVFGTAQVRYSGSPKVLQRVRGSVGIDRVH